MAQPGFVLSREAEADLASIADFVAAESGELRATVVITRINAAFRSLAFMPGIGRQQRDIDGAPYRFAVFPWIILYEPAPDLGGIHILRVYDGRRDLEVLLRNYKTSRRR